MPKQTPTSLAMYVAYIHEVDMAKRLEKAYGPRRNHVDTDGVVLQMLAEKTGLTVAMLQDSVIETKHNAGKRQWEFTIDTRGESVPEPAKESAVGEGKRNIILDD